MRICVLGSSSGGNATFVSDGTTRILIDTGNLPIFSHIRDTLAAIGEDWQALDGIFISHEHSDHLNSNTFSIACRTQTPVYVQEALALRYCNGRGHWCFSHLPRCQSMGLVQSMDGAVEFDGMTVRAFGVPHDSEPTVGFTVTGRDGRRVGIATDLGHCPPSVVRALTDCDCLVFEANHDVDLEWESGRPPDLVERVVGDYGHLSNEQSAAALCEIIGASRHRPVCVLLAHISQECNSPQLARKVVARAFAERHLNDIPVHPTFPRRRSEIICI